MNIEEVSAIAKRLLFARTALINEVPFFSRLLLHLKMGVADCETAYTDMDNVVFDPQFVKRLSDSEIEFVFLHEVLHCVLKHCLRGKGLNNLIYNIACDIVVNSVAMDILGMKSFFVDGESVMHIAPDGAEGREYTAEDIYQMLFHATPDTITNFCKLNGIDSCTSDKQGSFADMLTVSLENAAVFDSHNEWDNIVDGDMLSDLWNNYIKKAAENSRGASGLPGGAERYIDNYVAQTKVDWKQTLHDFICHNRSDFDFCVPDRRFDSDIIMPSFVENVYGSTVHNIWFLVDTSGSVSNDDIRTVYGEIVSCINQMDDFSGFLSFFDTEVTEPEKFEDKNDLIDIKPVGGGGTSFFAIFNFLKKYFQPDERPEAIIILTDGYASFPPESAALGIPVIWILFDSDIIPPWGKAVDMNG